MQEDKGPTRVFLNQTMPRSGHHFLVHMLAEYFDINFHYCEFYRPKDCCRQIPCKKPRHPVRQNTYFMQKSHDFHLNDPIDPEYRYVIQYRHPLSRAQSNFDFAVHLGRLKDNAQEFWKFLERELSHYIRFYGKWLLSPPPQSIVLLYEDLNRKPEVELRRTIEFMTGRVPDDARLNSSVKAIRPRNVHTKARFKAREARKYRYYDEAKFSRIEERVFAECPGIEIPKLFS